MRASSASNVQIKRARPVADLLLVRLRPVSMLCVPALILAWALIACGSTDARPASGRPKLTWAPPRLTDPLTVDVTDANSKLYLDPRRDYRINLPSRALNAEGGLWIVGGHNVVVVGGDIVVPPARGGPEHHYGVFAKNQTGTLHLEGLRIHGRGLAVGIVLDQGARAAVQIQNTRVDVSYPLSESIHPDVMQTWRGPYELRMDRLTGYTSDKGFNFQPHQYDVQALGTWDLRRVNIAGGHYLLWKNDWSLAISGRAGFWHEHKRDFYVRPGRSWGWAYPSRRQWGNVRLGRPKGGDFVPKRSVGAHYATPGYR